MLLVTCYHRRFSGIFFLIWLTPIDTNSGMKNNSLLSNNKWLFSV